MECLWLLSGVIQLPTDQAILWFCHCNSCECVGSHRVIQNDEFIVITFYVLLNILWQSGAGQLCQHMWLCFGIYHSCVRHSVQRCVTECTIAQQDEFCQIRHCLVSTHPTDEPIRNTMLYSECVAGECCDSVKCKVLTNKSKMLFDCTLSQLWSAVWRKSSVRSEIRSWSSL